MDNRILEQLYEKYYGSALLYTLSMCRDLGLAEDIVSEAFVKAYLSLPDDTPSFQYWLLKVCKNLWIDYVRKNSRLSDADISDAVADLETPDAALLKDEQKQLLWEAIHRLESSDRELVLLHYFSGMPLKQIAGYLNITAATTRQKLHRARLKLRKILEEMGYEI